MTLDNIEEIKALSYHTRVSEKHKYFAMTIPKVGAATIRRTLRAFEDGYVTPLDKLYEVHQEEVTKRLSSFSDEEIVEILTSNEWTRFTFVRNPYDRIYSAWKSKIQNLSDSQFEWTRNLIREAYGTQEIVFSDFVKAISEGVVPIEPHWQEQTDFLNGITFDHVGRFETFNEDFENILRLLNAPDEVIQIGTERTNFTDQSELADVYDKPIADLVHGLYSDTFSKFGYKKRSYLGTPAAKPVSNNPSSLTVPDPSDTVTITEGTEQETATEA